MPEFFGDAGDDGPAWTDGLDPAVLTSVFGAGDAARLAALAASEAVFAVDLHLQILEELALPTAAAGFGFEYLANGELPGDADAGGLDLVS